MARGKPKTPNQVGAPSARYPNRTDLAASTAAGPPTQPVRTPTGQGYGDAKALGDAQRAFPLPQPPETPPVPRGGGVERMPGTLTPMAAQGYTPPNLGLSSTPSGMPNEPVTAGLPVGPGAGPSAMSTFGAGALLAALAAATGDMTMAEMAEIADLQGF